MVGIAAEHEQVAHGNAAHDAVFLGKDRERTGKFGGGRGFDVFACVADIAVYQGLQARHKGEEGGLACAVRADQRGNAAFGNVEADVVEDGLLPMVWLTLRMVIIGGSENGKLGFQTAFQHEAV